MRFNSPFAFPFNSRELDAAMRLVDSFMDNLPRGGFPAYDLIRRGNGFEVVMAVAGFAESELSIEIEDGVLTVSGRKEETSEEGVTWIHRGIAQRSFKRSFKLSDAVSVDGADLKDGILTVKLSVHEPERKAQKIEIGKAA